MKKIKDTTAINVIIYNTFRYKVGDVTMILISEIYNKNQPPIRDFLINNYYIGTSNDNLFDVIYYKIFFLNSENKNFRSRKKFYRIIKDWYKKQ